MSAEHLLCAWCFDIFSQHSMEAPVIGEGTGSGCASAFSDSQTAVGIRGRGLRRDFLASSPESSSAPDGQEFHLRSNPRDSDPGDSGKGLKETGSQGFLGQ